LLPDIHEHSVSIVLAEHPMIGARSTVFSVRQRPAALKIQWGETAGISAAADHPLVGHPRNFLMIATVIVLAQFATSAGPSGAIFALWKGHLELAFLSLDRAGSDCISREVRRRLAGQPTQSRSIIQALRSSFECVIDCLSKSSAITGNGISMGYTFFRASQIKRIKKGKIITVLARTVTRRARFRLAFGDRYP
jgi:hypothetical protein